MKVAGRGGERGRVPLVATSKLGDPAFPACVRMSPRTAAILKILRTFYSFWIRREVWPCTRRNVGDNLKLNIKTARGRQFDVPTWAFVLDLMGLRGHANLGRSPA